MSPAQPERRHPTQPTGSASRKAKRVSPLAVHWREATRAAQRLWRARAGTAATVLLIGIALLLPALVVSLQRALQAGLQGVEAQASVSVYLTLESSNDDAIQVSVQILTLDGAESIERIEPDAALAALAASLGLADSLAALSSNPLPTTLLVSIDADAGALSETATALAASIRGLDGVDSVAVEGAWLQRLEALSSLLARAAQLLGLLVGVGLLTALGNTIRLAVEERRDEIRVSKLIGASDAYVARPFLYTGTFLGLAGGLLAALLLLIVVAVLTSTAQTLFGLYGSSATLPPLATLGLVLTPLGGALGWTAAFVASRRAISRCEP